MRLLTLKAILMVPVLACGIAPLPAAAQIPAEALPKSAIPRTVPKVEQAPNLRLHQYRARLRGASGKQFTAAGLNWQCDGAECTAAGSRKAALEVCRALAAEAGPLAAFRSGNQAMNASTLKRCNSVAVSGPTPKAMPKIKPQSMAPNAAMPGARTALPKGVDESGSTGPELRVPVRPSDSSKLQVPRKPAPKLEPDRPTLNVRHATPAPDAGNRNRIRTIRLQVSGTGRLRNAPAGEFEPVRLRVNTLQVSGTGALRRAGTSDFEPVRLRINKLTVTGTGELD